MKFLDNIKTELKKIEADKKNLKNFGWLIGGIFIAIGVIMLIAKSENFLYYLIIGFLFVIPAFVYPKVLKPFYFIWMGFSVVLGYFVSKIILGFLFFIVLTPVGLLMRIFKGDFLNLKIDKNKKSYWIKREDVTGQQTDPEKMY